MTKKILCGICAFLSILLIITSIIGLFFDARDFIEFLQYKNSGSTKLPSNINEIIFASFVYAFEHLVVILLSALAVVWCLISIIKPIVSNKSQYTYEEYKAKMNEKKALKKEAQKEKLKQKLNELEKGD